MSNLVELDRNTTLKLQSLVSPDEQVIRPNESSVERQNLYNEVVKLIPEKDVWYVLNKISNRKICLTSKNNIRVEIYSDWGD